MSDLESLGKEFQQARLKRDLSLLEVEKRTHIRARFLEALEEGQVGLLPSQAQTRGFIRNYARFLGFDGEATLARWDETIAGGRRRRAKSTPGAVPRATAQPRRSVRYWLLLLVLIFVCGSGIAVTLAGVKWLQDAQRNSPQQGDSIVLAVPTPSITPTLPTPSPTSFQNPKIPLPTTPTENVGDVILELQIVARTWLQVSVDDQPRDVGVFAPNVVLRYRGRKISFKVANGSGVKAILNGRDLGVLGARGQIVEQTFSVESLLAASLTPQVTATPLLPTITPSIVGPTSTP